MRSGEEEADKKKESSASFDLFRLKSGDWIRLWDLVGLDQWDTVGLGGGTWWDLVCGTWWELVVGLGGTLWDLVCGTWLWDLTGGTCWDFVIFVIFFNFWWDLVGLGILFFFY